MINSFDVFDTIMGRLSFSGIELFEVIENKLKIPNFKNLRQQSETKGIDNIYLNLKKCYNDDLIDWDKVKELELELEYELSFPINKYLNLIESNDILVSDMYLEEEIIKKIINKHKLINNKLFVETGHKYDCSFWTKNEISKKIKTHYGDNKISDYKNPMKYGINSILISNVDFTGLELKILPLNKYIAFIIRACRLTNQNDNFMNKIFNEISLPLCISICLYLNLICKQNSIDHIIFISRDGYWFKYMYNILFPDAKSTYFYLSMKMVENENFGSSLDILKNIPGKKIIFDLFGTGNTLTKLLGLLGNNTIGFMTFNHHKSKMLTVQNLAYRYMQYVDYVESLFPAPHGSALGYDDNNKLMFKDIEYDPLLLKDYMIGFETFKNYYNKLNNYINILDYSNYDLDKLKLTMFYTLNIGSHSFIKNIHNYINDNKIPDKNYNYYFKDLNIKNLIEDFVKFDCNCVFVNLTDYKNDTDYLINYLNWKEYKDFYPLDSKLTKIKLLIANDNTEIPNDCNNIEYLYIINLNETIEIKNFLKISEKLFKNIYI